MKHKHIKLIHAWIDGAEIESKGHIDKYPDADWEYSKYPFWFNDFEYRIKPEPQKQEIKEQEPQKEQETDIKNYEKVLKAYRELVEAQDKKIIDLTMKLTYANQTIENLTVDEPPKEQYLYVYRHIDTSKTMMSPTLMRDTSVWIFMGKVRVEK